jgi:hypothetical protein
MLVVPGQEASVDSKQNLTFNDFASENKPKDQTKKTEELDVNKPKTISLSEALSGMYRK